MFKWIVNLVGMMLLKLIEYNFRWQVHGNHEAAVKSSCSWTISSAHETSSIIFNQARFFPLFSGFISLAHIYFLLTVCLFQSIFKQTISYLFFSKGNEMKAVKLKGVTTPPPLSHSLSLSTKSTKTIYFLRNWLNYFLK